MSAVRFQSDGMDEAIRWKPRRSHQKIMWMRQYRRNSNPTITKYSANVSMRCPLNQLQRGFCGELLDPCNSYTPSVKKFTIQDRLCKCAFPDATLFSAIGHSVRF